jgi:hypothetical protein
MNTHDPDRCESVTELINNGVPVVVQCQESVYHLGRHSFHEDHYTVRWVDASHNW